jgi:hypothetical protein
MKRLTLLFAFALSATALLQAENQWSFKGTVTRMRMTECTLQHGFVSAMSGATTQSGSSCPEYTVMSDKVVYVVVGRHGEEFMPLAENMEFTIRKNELLIFSDDEKTKSHFPIQQMTLRAEWDREEERKMLAARMMQRSVDYEARNPPPISMTSSDRR